MIHLVDCCVALQLLLPLVIYATDHTGVQKLLKIDPVTLRGNALDYQSTKILLLPSNAIAILDFSLLLPI